MSSLFAKECFPAPRWAYLGRGLYLALFTSVTIASPLVLPAFSDQDALVWQRVAFFVMYAAASVACTALWRHLSPARTHRGVIVAGTLLEVGGVILYALVGMGLLPQTAMIASFAMAALGLPVLDAAWGEAYSHLPMRNVVAMVVASLAICATALLIVLATPPLLGFALLLALTLGGGVLLLVALARSPYRSYRDPEPLMPPSRERLTRLQPSWRFLLGVSLLVCAAYLLNGASERVGSAGYVTGEGVVLSIGACVALLVALKARPAHDPARFAVYLALFEALCFAVLALVTTGGAAGAEGASPAAAIAFGEGVAFGASGGAGVVAETFLSALILGCATCLGVLSWFVVIDVAQTTKTSPFRACALGLLAINVGKLAAEGASTLELAPGQICAVGLALVAFGVFFTTTHARPAEVELPSENSLATRATALAQRCELTPREHDVLLEWASGHNVAYVSEKLGISVSTAKTHIAHISQKTGTHGREELLRLLDEA